MNIIGRKNIFLGISGTLVVLALIAIFTFGFRQGIDFRGGTLWRFGFRSSTPPLAEVEELFRVDLGIEDAVLNRDTVNRTFFARFPVIEEEMHQEHLLTLEARHPDFNELSFESIGPSVGARLRRNALVAVGLVLVGISAYIAFAFRKTSRPVSSWRYGLVTLLTLFHDVLIPAGLLAILGRTQGVEIDSNFVVALLVVVGFSVHDTIVVFDRIRENLSRDRGKTAFGVLVNQSVNQTLRRSVFTSLTLILVLLALALAGPPNLFYFLLTLLVGVTVGTYSSIFVASPGLLLVLPKAMRRP